MPTQAYALHSLDLSDMRNGLQSVEVREVALVALHDHLAVDT